MISRDYVVEWRKHAPWPTDAQVEQDLVLSRAIVDIYSHPTLSKALAFRGGTALYKLHIRPPLRYSEDIDLVQVTPEPIGATMDAIRERLDPWLGTPRRQINEGRVILVYRFNTEGASSIPMRLKVEINSREHFSHLGYVHLPWTVESRWFTGTVNVTTFPLNELMGTKLRALYQRKKGRDLFDLWHVLDRGLVDPDTVVSCFLRYMEHGKTPVSRAEFEANLDAKSKMSAFSQDINPLLASTARWDPDTAFEVVQQHLITRLPGSPWQGRPNPQDKPAR